MSKLLSYLGGASKGFLEGVDKAEKNAREEALLRVKRLTENYEKVKEENGKLTNSLAAEEDWIKSYYPNATPEQVAYLQSSPAALQALKKMPDPTRIDLTTAININTNNPSASASINAIQNAPDVMKEVGGAIKSSMPAYRRGLGGIYDQFGEQAGKTAEMSAARAMGVDMQTMEALQPMQRPTQAGTFDAAAVAAASKGYSAQVDEAKEMMLQAQQSGDPKLIEAAQTVASSIAKTDAAFSPAEKQFAKTLDEAKNVLLNPDKFSKEEVDGANKVYNNFINIERRKAEGTRVSGGVKDDTPKLSTLNSFVSGAVSKELVAAFGQQVKDGQLTFTSDPSGNLVVNILTTDMEERYKLTVAQRDAAKRALSRFSDPQTGDPMTNDGKAVLDQYDAAVEVARKALPPTSPNAQAAPTAAPTQVAPTAAPAQAAAPTSGNSVTVKGQVYNRPSGFTDAQWNEYKKAMGAAQ